jgi:hypothetical protein
MRIHGVGDRGGYRREAKANASSRRNARPKTKGVAARFKVAGDATEIRPGEAPSERDVRRRFGQ